MGNSLSDKIKQLEGLKNEILSLKENAKKLRQEYNAEADFSNKKKINQIRIAAIDHYKKLKKLRSEVKNIYTDIVDHKNQGELQAIFKKKPEKKTITNDYLEGKIKSFQASISNHTIKRRTKEILGNKASHEYRKSLMIGATAGASYFLIENFLTKSLEPEFTHKEYSNHEINTDTATIETTTPESGSTDGDLEDISNTGDSNAVSITTEEQETSLLLDDLFFSLATASVAIAVAIFLAKLYFYNIKNYTITPIEDNIKAHEHVSEIIQHTEKNTSVENVEKFVNKLKEEEAKKNRSVTVSRERMT